MEEEKINFNIDTQKVISEISEQPEVHEQILVAENAKENTELVADGETKGSEISKFKSQAELLKAYTELEKEFTKKCQKLKAYEKNQNLDNVDKIEQKSTPEFDFETDKEKLKQFFVTTPDALQYADEISKLLSENTTLAKMDKGIELAYNSILGSKYKESINLVNDEEFLNKYIIPNENIERLIIENYAKKLASNNRTPSLLSKQGNGLPISTKSRITSFEEAGEVAKKYF